MKIINRPPLEKGFMKGGFFEWPEYEYECIGYTRRDEKIECGIRFKTTTANAERCPACRKKYLTEYFRLYNKGRREREKNDRS